MSGYFGPEGSGGYWLAVVAVTIFTVAYAWRGGMRASLTTDRVHIFLAFFMLALVISLLLPGLSAKGLPEVPAATRQGGLTFCALALVQIFSYPFHDPVLTDRGFLNQPKQALLSMLLAASLSGTMVMGLARSAFIWRFGRAWASGLYALSKRSATARFSRLHSGSAQAHSRWTLG